MSVLGRLLSRRDSAPPRQLAGGTRADVATYSGRWTNRSTGQGTHLDRHSRTTFESPMPLTMSEVDGLLEFQAVARRIVRREPDDAMREGFEIAELDDAQRSAVEQASARLGLVGKIKAARTWSRAYGGGAVIMMIDDGAPPWEPIRWSTLRGLRAIKAVDRYQLHVTQYDRDPASPDFGEPLMYSLAIQGVASANSKIHASRVARFLGTELPDRVMLARGGWGGSFLDLAWAELRNWCSSNENAAEAITLLSQGVFSSDYLADAMAAGDTQKAIDRMEALHVGLGLLGDIVIDKSKEDYAIHQRTLAGLRDALEALTTALVSATDMPRSVLMGEVPGGLNSGEAAGEIRSWYDHVASIQPEIYSPPLTKILRVLLHGSDGPLLGRVPPGWKVEWPSLWQMTDAEQATIRLQRAQARAADATVGAVTEDEIRQDRDFVEHYAIDPDMPAPGRPEATGFAVPGAMAASDPKPAALPAIKEADESEFPADEALVSLAEAARRMGCGPAAIRSMAARGEIPAARVGTRWRVAMSQVIAAASKAGKARGSVDPPDPPTPRPLPH